MTESKAKTESKITESEVDVLLNRSKKTDTTIENDDENHRIVIPTHTTKELTDRLETLSKSEDFEKKTDDNSTLEAILLKMSQVFSSQFELLQDCLSRVDKLEKTKKVEKTNDDDEIVDSVIMEDKDLSFSTDLGGRKISGDEAELYLLASNKNIRKIILLNSGFNIVISAPTLSDLNNLYNLIIDEIGEYGRIFGSFSFLYSDITIKSALCELIKKLTISSNLKDWKKGSVLMEAISFHDFPSILHGLAYLMFSDGYEFRYVCPTENCGNSEIEIIDISSLKFYNFNKIASDQLSNIFDKKITLKDVKNYKKDLDLNKIVTLDNYEFYLTVPSIDKFLSYGKNYNIALAEVVQNGNKDEIQSYLKFNYFKIFAPWISRINRLEDGKVNFTIEDSDSVLKCLDILQSSTDDFDSIITPIVDFIKISALTQIVIPINECSKCHKLPAAARNGLLPIDVQEFFFQLSVKKLIMSSQV